MDEASRNNAATTRGRPFKSGNSGRPKGARNASTIAAELLLDGEAEALTRKAVELAMAGDSFALRLCLERVMPPRKDRPVKFTLPKVESAEGAASIMASLITAVSKGELRPSEATEIAKLFEFYIRTIETVDTVARLETVEALLAERGENAQQFITYED